MRTHTVHTHMLSSLHSPALISSWLSASCYSAGDDTHTRTPTHTNAHTYVPLRSLKSHSCFLPNHCSHKILTHIEWKLNKPRYLKAVGRFFRRNPRHNYLFSTLNTIVGHRRSVCGHNVLFFMDTHHWDQVLQHIFLKQNLLEGWHSGKIVKNCCLTARKS